MVECLIAVLWQLSPVTLMSPVPSPAKVLSGTGKLRILGLRPPVDLMVAESGKPMGAHILGARIVMGFGMRLWIPAIGNMAVRMKRSQPGLNTH
jgi:hypothetical protein